MVLSSSGSITSVLRTRLWAAEGMKMPFSPQEHCFFSPERKQCVKGGKKLFLLRSVFQETQGPFLGKKFRENKIFGV